MNLDETNKRLDELTIRASYRYINDIGGNMDDILKDCLDEEESKNYDFLIKLKQQLEEEKETKQLWKRIEDLEQRALQAFREHTEWGYYLEALCAVNPDDYIELMSLYKKVDHKTYWRK